MTVSGHRLEYEDIPAARDDGATLVLLHEGLGSVAMWRDFPVQLAVETGARVVVYSRYGYGRSDALTAPRQVDYMHREALETLPELCARLKIDAPVLIGHSDGASIALIHAGAGRWPVCGVVVMAPHVFVEDVTIRSIEQAKMVYETTNLKERLGRYHDDVDSAFRGWNDIWLHPDFRSWNIESCLPGITAPLLMIQGLGDEYGTLAQIDAIARQVRSKRVEKLLLPDCKHSPHRDQTEATLKAIRSFVAAL